jgi:histone deacetylase HOS3
MSCLDTPAERANGQIQTICQAIDKVCDYIPSDTIRKAPSTPPHNIQSDGSGFNKAFCAIRPPGHHCGEDLPSGYVPSFLMTLADSRFCYVNNVVVGALHGMSSDQPSLTNSLPRTRY